MSTVAIYRFAGLIWFILGIAHLGVDPKPICGLMISFSGLCLAIARIYEKLDME